MSIRRFSPTNFNTIVDGIVQAIARAHLDVESRGAGHHVYINSGKLYNSNINRSPNAYLNNPEEERAAYPDGNTDKTMTVVRLEDEHNVRSDRCRAAAGCASLTVGDDWLTG